jgi:hypothetical protein
MVMVASVADRAGEGAVLVAAAMVLFVLREVVFGGILGAGGLLRQRFSRRGRAVHRRSADRKRRVAGKRHR